MLPQELIEMIIDEVDSLDDEVDSLSAKEDRRAALSCCSIVSRNWLRRARYLLFKSIDICEHVQDGRRLSPPASPGESKVHLFLQLLKSSPNIATCIQSLSIRGAPSKKSFTRLMLRSGNLPVLEISNQ